MSRTGRAVAFVVAVLAMAGGDDATGAVACLLVALLARPAGDAGAGAARG